MGTKAFIDNKAVDLIAAPQTLTGSWVDIGLPVVAGDYEFSAIWLELDINNSTGVKIRALASPTEAFTVAYDIPIQNIAPDLINLLPQYFTFGNDVDQNMVIPLDIGDVAPFIKFQCMATVVGTPAGQLLSAKIAAKTIGRGK